MGLASFKRYKREKARREAEEKAKAGTDKGEFPNEKWTVKELQAYAKENEIDLLKAKSKADILAVIR